MPDDLIPVALPAAISPRVLRRDDLVVRRGLLTLLNQHLTPREAMIEDLLFLRDALEKTRIPFFLVRDDDERPVLVVDWKLRKRVRARLARATVDEPFYSRAADGTDRGPVLVAEGALSVDSKARAVTVYRPRVDAMGRLRYGAASGVRLEFWEWSGRTGSGSGMGRTVTAPNENVLTRRVFPAAEVLESEVVAYGCRWRTIEGMFARYASDVDFDIDIVFSWVDGASVEWQRARAKRMESYVVGDGDNAEARYRQIDELRYALRSVHLFAPWIRRIFIATDSDVPAWLRDDPKVQIVRSEDFFPDLSVLPTHNSHAIEANLQHIPGLSEHFLYSNDDMFFGRPVSPSMFFSPGGVTKFIEATTRIGLGSSDASRSGFENAARVNRGLLEKRFGRVTTRHLEHAATPLRKSVLQELEQEFAAEFERTTASAFRSATDISVTNSLYHYYALMSGRAVVQTEARVRYVDTTTRAGLRELKSMLKTRKYDFFCLNDGSYPEVDAAERATVVRSFLDRYFPIPAPWENTAIGAPGVVSYGEAGR